MAQKRMFNAEIVESDVFLDLPLTAQSLYFHLCMNADDYGFVQPRKIMRVVGAGVDDLRILVMKRYVLQFESGVTVIKHWLINNTIRKDRSKETTYQTELRQLTINEWGAYTEKRNAQTTLLGVDSVTTINRGDEDKIGALVDNLATQSRLEETRLDKISNKHADAKAPRKSKAADNQDSEIGKLYYRVIKEYDLPVTNHNVIWTKIRQWEKESSPEEAIEYLKFLLNQYRDIKLKYKPEISTALDIYSKRAMIRNAIMRKVQKQPIRSV